MFIKYISNKTVTNDALCDFPRELSLGSFLPHIFIKKIKNKKPKWVRKILNILSVLKIEVPNSNCQSGYLILDFILFSFLKACYQNHLSKFERLIFLMFGYVKVAQ